MSDEKKNQEEEEMVFDTSKMTADQAAAMEVAEFDPIVGRDKFQAILDLYQDFTHNRDQQQCVIAARKQVAVLDRVIEKDIELRRQQLLEALKGAEGIRPNNPERADAICRAIITLYADREWARVLVDKAQMLTTSPRE